MLRDSEGFSATFRRAAGVPIVVLPANGLAGRFGASRHPDGAGQMILVTRLNGPQFAVNADLIERAEATPDTVLTLVDGTKYLVAESVQEVIDRVRQFRASVLVAAKELEQAADQPLATLRALPGPTET
jgi:flagellar protein FlbD